MSYTMPVTKEMVTARTTASISTKNAVVICRHLNRMQFKRAKKTISDIVEKKKSIKGCYYTSASENIKRLLESLESNAKARDIEPGKMILFISAHQGATMMRARRKRRHGTMMKSTNLQAILKPGEEKVEKKKEEKKVEKK
ncbi:MAG: uL22 family ribosomal protein [Candidatus Aenigmatarchaeota archaeon]